MDADDYQELAMRTAGPAIGGTDEGLVVAALGLCGESGEIADHIKKVRYHAHPLDEDKLRAEAGDVAWYLARLCTAMGWSLGDVLAGNIEKLRRRYPEGHFSTERSLHRAGSDREGGE